MPSSWRSRCKFVSNLANTPNTSRKHLPAAVPVSMPGDAEAYRFPVRRGCSGPSEQNFESLRNPSRRCLGQARSQDVQRPQGVVLRESVGAGRAKLRISPSAGPGHEGGIFPNRTRYVRRQHRGMRVVGKLHRRSPPQPSQWILRQTHWRLRHRPRFPASAGRSVLAGLGPASSICSLLASPASRGGPAVARVVRRAPLRFETRGTPGPSSGGLARLAGSGRQCPQLRVYCCVTASEAKGQCTKSLRDSPLTRGA
jgi:hypothetical protein